jgi:hypothetical protein
MVRSRGRRWLIHLLAGTMAALGVLTVAPAADAADPGLLSPCSSRSGFGGSHYCLVAVNDVTSGAYGDGKRVYVTGTISAVTDTTMTVAEVHWSNPCPPEKICGPTIDVRFDKLTVQTPGWTGVHRPPLGYLVRLYGTTTKGSLKPVGYIKTTYCGPAYELCL